MSYKTIPKTILRTQIGRVAGVNKLPSVKYWFEHYSLLLMGLTAFFKQKFSFKNHSMQPSVMPISSQMQARLPTSEYSHEN